MTITDTCAEFVTWAYGLFKEIPNRGDLDREIVVTPYEGHYGIAGYIITVNGSPARVTILVETTSGNMVALRGGRMVRGESRRVGCVTKSKCQRYSDAVDWLIRLGVDEVAGRCKYA